MQYEVDKKFWRQCEICKKSISEIKKDFGGEGSYFSEAFLAHIKNDHSITPQEYFYDTVKIDIKKCSCGICNQICGFTLKGSKICYKKYICGRNDGMLKWAEEARTTRRGKGNPAFGKAAWNKGKTKENCDTIRQMAQKNKGRVTPDEIRKKQSESAKKRTVHGHTGKKHTEESKDLMRQATLKNIKDGKFKQTITKPHSLLSKTLTDLKITHINEYQVHYYSIDIYIPSFNIYIEVDGDYFHSNPKIYPNGPITKTQKINAYNDNRKDKYFSENGLVLLRFWESDILNDIESVKCKLLKLIQ